MDFKKIRVVFGVTMPDGQYNNDKSIEYSVPAEINMALSSDSDYVRRWRKLVQLDMMTYCRAIGAEPVVIMCSNTYHKYY